MISEKFHGKIGKKDTITWGYTVFGISWTIERIHRVYRARLGIKYHIG